VLATGDFDGVVILWNVESGAVRHRLVPPPLPSATPSTSGRPDYAPRSDRAAESLSFIDGGRASWFMGLPSLFLSAQLNYLEVLRKLVSHFRVY
jgi:hypothetical protein